MPSFLPARGAAIEHTSWCRRGLLISGNTLRRPRFGAITGLSCGRSDSTVSIGWSARASTRAKSAQLRLLRARETFGFRFAGGSRWITRDLGLDQRGYDALHRAALSAELAKIILNGGSPGNARFVEDTNSQAAAREWLRAQGYRSGVILAVHSGAGNPIRQWREPYFETVLRSLTASPAMIVFIDPEPTQLPPEQFAAPHAIWQGNLTELKSLLSVCDVFFGTDSGIMHMAAAAGCEVVAAFGPTEPRRFRPFGEHHEIVIVEPMPCRPCMDACIHRSPLCMDQLEDRALAAAVDRKLVATRNRARAG